MRATALNAERRCHVHHSCSTPVGDSVGATSRRGRKGQQRGHKGKASSSESRVGYARNCEADGHCREIDVQTADVEEKSAYTGTATHLGAIDISKVSKNVKSAARTKPDATRRTVNP